MLTAEAMPARRGRPPVAKPLPKAISVRLTDEEYEQLCALSRLYRASERKPGGVAGIIRAAIRRYLRAARQ